jgi:hypothetical protein
MGAARETWDGLGYQMGFRDGMNWIAASQQWDATPSVAERTVRLHVAAAERVGGAAELLAAGLPNAVVTLRVPTTDGIPNAWIYGTWRAMYNRAVMTGLSLAHVPLDHNPLANPVSSAGNALGPPTVLDVVPSTLDQMDAEIPPGGAFVYGAYGGKRTLLEVFAAMRVPANSTDAADDVLPVRVTALTPANERPEGRGCVPGAAALLCQATAEAATLTVACNANVSAVLTQVAPVAIFQLALPAGTAGDAAAVLAHTCGSLPVATHLGVFADFPAAQALARAHVGAGAITFAEQRFTVAGVPLGTPGVAWTGPVASQACGEVAFPLTDAQPLYLVVALAAPATLLASSAAAVPVALSVTCAAEVANLRSFIRHDATVYGGDWQGIFQHHASSGATGIVTQRRQYIKPAHPWFSVNKIESSSVEWRWGSTSYRNYNSFGVSRGEPAPAGTFEVVNISTLDGTGVTMRYACPPDMYGPSAGSLVCAACPMGAVSVAGALGVGPCVCGRGWGYSSATRVCSRCPEGTYKATETDAACTACPTGATSAVGAVNSMACKTVWCDRVQFAGHSDGRVNGAFAKSGTYGGVPYYRREGGVTHIFKNGWNGAWSFTDDTSRWPTFSTYFGGGYDMNARVSSVPPQFWRSADWGSALTAGRNVTAACTCVAPKSLDAATGACVAPASTPAPAGPSGCAVGAFWTGTTCTMCPPYQVAAPGGAAACVCPRGYTSPGATFACEPPRVLLISVASSGGAPAAVVAGLVGTYALVGSVGAPALRGVNASEPYAPTYGRVNPLTSAPGAPFLVGHQSRGEWSFTPALSPSHSPRYGYWGDFAGGGGNLPAVAGGAGVFPPLAPSASALLDAAALAALNSTAWAVPFSVFDGSALFFSTTLTLVLQPADVASPSSTPSPTPSPGSASATPTGTSSRSGTRTATRSGTRTASGSATATASCGGPACACTPSTCDFRIREGAASGGYWTVDAVADNIRLQGAAAAATVFRMMPGVVCGVAPLSSWDRLVTSATLRAVNHANFALHAAAWAMDACPTSAWLDVAWRVEMAPAATSSAFRLLNPYSGGVYATLSADGLVAITSTPDTARLWYFEWVGVPASASPSGSASGAGTLSATVTASLSASSTGSWTATGTAASTPSASGTPPATPSATRSPASSPTRSPTPTGTPTRTGTRSGTPTASWSASRSATGSPTVTATATSTVSGTRSSSRAPTPTVSGSSTASTSSSASSSASASAEPTGSATRTQSATKTISSTQSATKTISSTLTGTRSESGSGTLSRTGTSTSTPSRTGTPSSSATPSASGTASTAPTGTATPSLTPSLTESGTPEATPSASGTLTGTKTRAPTRSVTRTRSGSGTGSRGAASPSRSRTGSVTRSRGGAGKSATATRSRTRKPKRRRA